MLILTSPAVELRNAFNFKFNSICDFRKQRMEMAQTGIGDWQNAPWSMVTSFASGLQHSTALRIHGSTAPGTQFAA
ncbi:hypothetical protein ACLKA6_007117 [Drosophila palustris]